MADQRAQQLKSRNSNNKKETAACPSGHTNDWSVSQHEAYLFLMTLLPPLTHQKVAQMNLFIVAVSIDNFLTAWSNWDVGFPWKSPKTDETSPQCPVQCAVQYSDWHPAPSVYAVQSRERPFPPVQRVRPVQAGGLTQVPVSSSARQHKRIKLSAIHQMGQHKIEIYCVKNHW